ncbi:hypothetical protein BH09MYX1_BH09MYX1_16780 [soil metagenome]
MRAVRGAILLVAVGLGATNAGADGAVPPWSPPGEVPIPTWAHSVTAKGVEQPILAAPRMDADRRATAIGGMPFPIYGAARGTGCGGRYYQVGTSAWLCSDLAELSPSDALPPSRDGLPLSGSDALPYRYYFVGKEGANGYLDLARAGDEAPDEQLDPGFAVAVVEERIKGNETWGRTHHGPWVSLRDLGAARPSGFRGEERGVIDFAWVLVERAPVYASIARGKAVGTRAKFEVVAIREERAGGPGTGAMVRISEDGVTPPLWIDRRVLAKPGLSTMPAGVAEGERWIDVDLATQTLVAYEGAAPVFATLVSTGKGAPGTDSATHPGTFRIWVKLTTSTMDNLEADEADHRYSMEDVPYVQFFDKAIALHGVFWHSDFGRTHSHGCVNLAPTDARWLFRFTAPKLGAGMAAILPAPNDKGTVVRVR